MTHSATQRRKYPRKPLNRSVGILFAGNYFIGRVVEIGEGGIAIHTEFALSEGGLVVLSFQIPRAAFMVVRAVVRNIRKQPDGSATYGIEFLNANFDRKREIRAYVTSQANQIVHGESPRRSA